MALLPLDYSGSLAQGLQTAYQQQKKKQTTTPKTATTPTTKTTTQTTTQTSSRNIGLRDYFESKGYEVKYDEKTGNIEIVDPRTGSAATVTKAFYDVKDNRAYISSDMVKKVEETIRSGLYKLPGYSSSSSSKSSATSSLAAKQTTAEKQTTTSKELTLREQLLNYSRSSPSFREEQRKFTYGVVDIKNPVPPAILSIEDIKNAKVKAILPDYISYHYPHRRVSYDPISGDIILYDPDIGGYAVLKKDVHYFIDSDGKLKTVPGIIEQADYIVAHNYNKLPGYERQSQGYTVPTSFGSIAYDYINEVSEIRREFESLIKEASNSPSIAALIERSFNTFIEELNRVENQIMQMFQQQLGGIDPATMAAIRSIRETVSRQRQNLMEEMSRRGLLQSGIWLEMERRLAEGELTAQEQLLAQRVSDLQTRMLQVLTNFANMRLQAIQTYGLAGVEAAERESLRRQQMLERNLQMALDEAYRRRQLALQEFQVMAPYLYTTEAQRQTMPLEWAQTIGEVPVGPGFENVPVRSYVGSAGTVDWDPATGEVIINGTRVKPSAVGGFIKDGTAYLPKNLVDRLLGRY